MNGSGSQYQDLLNNTITYTDTINLSALDPMSVPYVDASQNLQDYILTNGELLIGDTNNNPKAATLTGSSNVTIVNGAGSITIDAAQGINPGSSPTFVDVTLTGLTASELVATNGSKQLESITITNANGTNLSFSGSTLAASMTQSVDIGSDPSFSQPFLTGIPSGSLVMTVPFTIGTKQIVGVSGAGDGLLPIGGTLDACFVSGHITGSSNLTVTNGAHSISLDTIQPIQTTSSVTFGSITDSALTTNSLVCSNPSGLLEDSTITNSNSNGNTSTLAFSGTTLALTSSLSQSIQTTASPTFEALTLTNTTDQLILGTTKTITIDSVAPAASEIITIPDPGGPATLALINSATAPLNGAVLIGNGTHSMTPATITGTPANGVVVTNSSGGITLSTVQAIGAGNSPVFSGLTLSGVGNAPLCTSGTGVVEAMSITNSNGVLSTFIGGSLGLSMTQNLATSGSPQFTSATIPTFNTSINVVPSSSVASIELTSSAGNGSVSRADISGTSLTDSAGNYVRVDLGSVTTLNNILDNGSGGMTISAGATLNVDTIVGTSTDLRINPKSATGSIFLGHDSTTTNVEVGTGTSGGTAFAVNSAGSTIFSAFGTEVTTLNNTLDSGVGNMSVTGNFTCSKIIQSGINNIIVTGLLTLPASPATLTPVQLFTNLAFNNTTGAYSLTFPTGASIVSFLSSTYGYTLAFNGAFNFRLVNVSSSAISLNAGTGNTFILPNPPFNTATNAQPANTCYTYTFLYAGSNTFFICGG
jgi:hypothetical protein